jgi:NTE family protein
MESTLYKNLVIEGGGVLGIAYCGALKELENCGILAKLENFAGASAGAIVAGALACGGRSEYINKIMRAVNFRDFLDYGNGLRAVYRVLRYKGACPGDYFSRWYGEIIKELTGNAAITLKQRYDLFGGRLVIAVVNLSKQRVEFWDHITKPDMPIVLGARASMSISVIFEPVEIDGDLYVDGGTLCNYPIKAFHYDGPDGDIVNPHTLGLMLMSDREITEEYPRVNGLISYAIACIECLWTQPQKMHMDAQDWARTIKIPTGGISSINFSISQEHVEALIKSGADAVKKHFAGEKTYTSGLKNGLRARFTPELERAITISRSQITHEPNLNTEAVTVSEKKVQVQNHN